MSRPKLSIKTNGAHLTKRWNKTKKRLETKPNSNLNSTTSTRWISPKQNLWYCELSKKENDSAITTSQLERILRMWLLSERRSLTALRRCRRARAQMEPGRIIMKTSCKRKISTLLWISLCASSTRMLVSCPLITGFSMASAKSLGLSLPFC